MAETKTNLDRQTYLEERKLLIDAEREAAKSFDQAMIALSAGALGLSITFIKQLAPSPSNKTLIFLYIAWGGFAFALVSTLSSFLLSQSALRKQREILDSTYDKESSENNNLLARITNWLNWLSILFFILGVLNLAFFSIKNFP